MQEAMEEAGEEEEEDQVQAAWEQLVKVLCREPSWRQKSWSSSRVKLMPRMDLPTYQKCSNTLTHSYFY